jgi:hypothetical protein
MHAEEAVDAPKRKDGAPLALKKRTRERQPGTEQREIIEGLQREISRIEGEIDKDAAKFEECRRLMSLGVASYDALQQEQKMIQLLAQLKLKQEERNVALQRYEEHLKGLEKGDAVEVAIDKIHEQRAKRRRLYPREKEKKPVEAEILEKIEQVRGAAGKYADIPRTNAANCPSRCENLEEHMRDCNIVCPDCGTIYGDLTLDMENPLCTAPKFGEWIETSRHRSGGYKPPTHFAEIIGHFQGNRSSQTPEDIMNKIKVYCGRYHYADKDITPAVARFFLRRMQQDENRRHAEAVITNPQDKIRRYTDYYKHAPEIAHKLSGIPPPYLSPMQEERVMSMFPLVIAAYKTSPRYLQRLGNRKGRVKAVPNMPNYLYVLYKIMQLLGYTEFLPYVPLPKSADNTIDNDRAGWKHICETYDWQYIPTI